MLIYLTIGLVQHLASVLALLYLRKRTMKPGRLQEKISDTYEGGLKKWNEDLTAVIRSTLMSPVIIILGIVLWPLNVLFWIGVMLIAL